MISHQKGQGVTQTSVCVLCITAGRQPTRQLSTAHDQTTRLDMSSIFILSFDSWFAETHVMKSLFPALDMISISLHESKFTAINEYLQLQSICVHGIGWRTRLMMDLQSSQQTIVKLRQGSGKDRQGMALKAKGLKALTLDSTYTKVGLPPPTTQQNLNQHRATRTGSSCSPWLNYTHSR